MPRFFHDIVNVENLTVCGAFAYASRCVRRVLPLGLDLAGISNASAATNLAVSFAELRATGDEIEADYSATFPLTVNKQINWNGGQQPEI